MVNVMVYLAYDLAVKTYVCYGHALVFDGKPTLDKDIEEAIHIANKSHGSQFKTFEQAKEFFKQNPIFRIKLKSTKPGDVAVTSFI
jgi:hypothetical protein